MPEKPSLNIYSAKFCGLEADKSSARATLEFDLAGIEASAAVQRARPDAESIARNWRRFRIAVLILFLFLASIIAAIWLAERATQGS